MKRIALFLAIFCGITNFLSAQNPEGFDKMIDDLYEYTIPFITAEKLDEMRKQNPNIVILDSRKKEEYNVSHIPGAKFVDYLKFKMKYLKGISKDTPIYVYCSVGYRSEKIAKKLAKEGYNVYNLYGGIFEWKNKNKTVIDTSNTETNKVHCYNEDWSKWLVNGEKVYD